MSSMPLDKYSANTVLNALNDFVSSDTKAQHQAAQFLLEFQDLFEAWSTSNILIANMKELPEHIVCLAAVIMQHKIYTHWEQVNINDHAVFFGNYIQYIVIAHNIGFRKLMEKLAAIVASLVLRLKQDFSRLCACVTPTAKLIEVAPLAYFEVLYMLPSVAKQLHKEELLQCEIPNLMIQLSTILEGLDIKDTCKHRTCMRIFTSWIRSQVLALNQIADHFLVSNAFELMKNTKLFEGQLYEEASKLLCEFIGYLLYVKQNSFIDAGLEENIYAKCCMVTFPTEADMKIRIAAGYFLIKVNKVFAGLNSISQSSSMLKKRGAFCYELLLQVALYCDLKTATSSMSNWINLFEKLQYCYDYETHEMFQPLVMRLITILYNLCRYPQERIVRNSTEYDDKLDCRLQLSVLLAKLVYLHSVFSVKELIKHCVNVAFEARSSWMDVEASLFFISSMIAKMNDDNEEIVRDLMLIMPGYLNIHSNHPAVTQQMILVCAECHKCTNQAELRQSFIDQLINLSFELCSAQSRMEHMDKCDTLDVIINSCTLLVKYHPYDLTLHQMKFNALTDLVIAHKNSY